LLNWKNNLFCRIYLITENPKFINIVAESFRGSKDQNINHGKKISIDELPAHKIAILSGQTPCFGPDEIDNLNLGKLNIHIPDTKKCNIQIAPLIYGSEPLGCLVIGTDNTTVPDSGNKTLFDNLARFLSPAIENAISYARLSDSFDLLKIQAQRQLFDKKITAAANLAENIVRLFSGTIVNLNTNIDTLDRELIDTEQLSAITDDISQIERFIARLRDFAFSDNTGQFRQIELAQLIRYAENKFLNDPLISEAISSDIHIVTRNIGSGQIFGDPEAIYKLISILVVNSVGSMKDGGEITIESKIEGNSGIITVSDEGCGILSEIGSRVFEPFYSTNPGVGRGLGLAIAHRIIHSHGGSISIESSQSNGTVVKTKIPLIDPEQTALYSLKKKSTNRILLSP